MDYLGDDIWVEILKTLPVDLLSRFRCVCKSWNSLISSPDFIRAQYLHSSNSADPKPYFLFDESISSYAFYNPQITDSPIDFLTLPFDVVSRPRVIGDVIHGVVCLSIHGLHRCTILWNPAIHKFFSLPRRDSIDDAGFGFDGRTDDFKVVRHRLTEPTTLEVYSYREDRSTTVGSDHIGPFSLVTDHCSCFKNGAVYFLIRRRNSSMIAVLVFDCETDELKILDLPDGFNRCDLNVSVTPVRIFVYLGKISILEITKTTDEGGEAAMWAMDEYGWKKTAHSSNDFVKITYFLHFSLIPSVDFRIYDRHSTTTCYKTTKRSSQQPWNGYVFEPSMFLMDAERVTTRSRRWVDYIEDGSWCVRSVGIRVSKD